jgi:SagB-type dehydrogenase family enzyme
MFMEKRMFWVFNVGWHIDPNSGELCIESCRFTEDFAKLFPKFYYVLSKGALESEIFESFQEVNKVKLKRFVRKLMALGFLCDKPLDTYQVFYRQDELFQPEVSLPHEYFLTKENVEAYRLKALTRKPPVDTISYRIAPSGVLPKTFKSRRTVRNFDTSTPVTFQQLSAILECCGQYGERKYCYPSAGGLYPIDCYIHVKKNRVEGVEEGLYIFDPIQSTLNYVSSGSSIKRDLHYFLNRDIFDTSAFTMYLFYNCEVSMPKYGARAYYYGIYDAGILTGYINLSAETVGVSSCSIGSVKNFSNVCDEFHLSEHQIFLHSIEFGIRRDV